MMKTRPKALGFKCLVLPDPIINEKEVKTESGLIVKLALSVDERLERGAQVRGTIVDIGEDFAAAYKPKTPFWGLKVGDKIWYARYAGKWVTDKENNRDLLVLNDEDICVQDVVEETEDVFNS